MKFTIVIVVLFLFELLYFKIAEKYNIIDKPNHRSSHSRTTIRGGGIIFPLTLLIAYVFGYASFLMTLAISFVAVVSFVDDVKPLHYLPRFGSQIIAFLLVVYDLQLFREAIWFLPTMMIFLIGWINAFNFMDGINGITVLYALTALLSFSVLPANANSLPLLIMMGLACLVFGFFNVRRTAKTFAGDVGSISLALFLGYFMMTTIINTRQIGYLLFFSVYGVDAIITLFSRIRKKENIFEAHRSHLYEYLVNEFGYSHILIASIYALVQLLLNGIVLYMDHKRVLSFFITCTLFMTVTIIYILVRRKFVGRLRLKN